MWFFLWKLQEKLIKVGKLSMIWAFFLLLWLNNRTITTWVFWVTFVLYVSAPMTAAVRRATSSRRFTFREFVKQLSKIVKVWWVRDEPEMKL